MTIKVYKYPLNQGQSVDQGDSSDTCIAMKMPARHVLLDIQMKRDPQGEVTPTLWAEVDTEAEDHEFRFWIVLTGASLPTLPEGHFLTYLRTLQDPDTGLVLHVYQQQFKVTT